MSEYTQGVCMDGAAILKDGQMMTIEEILGALRDKSTMPSDDELAALVDEFMDDSSLKNEDDFVFFAKEVLNKWGNGCE